MEMQITVGAAFIAMGVLVAFILLRKVSRAMQSKRWPGVMGEILSAGTKRVEFSGVQERGGRDSAAAAVVDFRYRYVVDGEAYEGTRVTFSDFVNKTSGSLEKLQAQFARAGAVTVYYNPADPADGVLVPGTSVYNFTPLVTALLFVGAGCYVMTL